MSEAVSLHDFPIPSRWSLSLWSMIGGALLSLAVLVWMMSGASSRASSWSERTSDRQRRYQDAEQGEVSDPEEWMRIHHHDYDSSMEGTPGGHGGEPEAEAEPPAASADTVASLDRRIFLIFFALVDANIFVGEGESNHSSNSRWQRGPQMKLC